MYRVFIFHGSGECVYDDDHALHDRDNSGEIAVFRNTKEALEEIEDRVIDYGSCTQIVHIDESRVCIVLETTDKGCTWNVPTHGQRSVKPVLT